MSNQFYEDMKAKDLFNVLWIVSKLALVVFVATLLHQIVTGSRSFETVAIICSVLFVICGPACLFIAYKYGDDD